MDKKKKRLARGSKKTKNKKSKSRDLQMLHKGGIHMHPMLEQEIVYHSEIFISNKIPLFHLLFINIALLLINYL